MSFKSILLIFLSISVLSAQDKRKIGLVPFTNVSKDAKYDWISYGFEYFLSNKLAVISGFFVPEKGPFHKILKEVGFGMRPIDERMIYHIGRYAGVEVTVSGKYVVTGNNIEMQVTFSNAFNGSTILQSDFNEPLANFFPIGRKITDQLINVAGISVSENEQRLLDFTLTKSPVAFESFVKAYMESEKPNSRIEGVSGLFRKAIKEDANFWEAYYNLGIIYFNSQSYSNALEQFNKVITALPSFDKPYYGRGLIYEKQKKYKEAIEDFRKVTEFNPNDYKPFYYLGKISIFEREYAQAEIHLNKARELNPEYAPTYFELGNIYYDQNIFRKSIDYYKKAAELDANNADYHLKLGDTYYRSQIFYNALNEINATIAIRPNDAIAYFLKGITIYKQAVLEELVEAFLDLLSENPGNPGVQEKKFSKKTAIDPIKKKQVYVDMAATFSEAVKARPNFIEALFNLALTYHEMGESESSEKYYILTLQTNPNLLRAHMKLAELYTETNRKPLAIEQYRRAFYIAPASFVREPTLGPEHQYINVFELFKKEIDDKLQRNPEDIASNLIMAKIFQAQGHLGKAANLARKVLIHNPNNDEAKTILSKVE